MTSSHHGDTNPAPRSRLDDGNPSPPAEDPSAPLISRQDAANADAGAVDRVRAAVAAAAAPVRMPDDVAARLRARLDTELGGLPAGARPRRGPRIRRAAVLAAAAAVVGALAAVPVLTRPTPGPVRVAEDTPEALWRAASGAGPAVDGGWARACLAAAGAADPAAPLLASRPYPVAGEPGLLLVLGTPERGRSRIVVVPADCGPGTARILAETGTR